MASISSEIQMCGNRRQTKGRMKGSLGLIISLKTEFLIVLVTPSGFSVPGGFKQRLMASPFFGEKSCTDIGMRISAPNVNRDGNQLAPAF